MLNINEVASKIKDGVGTISAAGLSAGAKIAIGTAAVGLGLAVGVGVAVNNNEKPVKKSTEFVTAQEEVVSSIEEYKYGGISAAEKIKALGDIPVRDLMAGGFNLCIGETSLGKAKDFYSIFGYEEQVSDMAAAYVNKIEARDYLCEKGIYNSYLAEEEYKDYASYLDEIGGPSAIEFVSEMVIPVDNRYNLYLYFMDLEGGTMDYDDRILMDVRIEYEENAEHIQGDFDLMNGLGENSSCTDWAAISPMMRDYGGMWGCLTNNDTFMVAVDVGTEGNWDTSTPKSIEVGFGPAGNFESENWRARIYSEEGGETGLKVAESVGSREFGGLTDEMFDDSVTFPEGVYKLRPDETYKAGHITGIEEYVDPNTGKNYYLITFDIFNIYSISKEHIGDYQNVTAMFEGDVTFYYGNDDGDFIYDIEEVLAGNMIDKMLALTLEYPNNPTMGKGEDRQVKFKWNGVGTRIKSGSTFV